MADTRGFWSYVHADDGAEGGRIRQIADDLSAAYEMMTVEPLRLFVDRSHIEWGNEWRESIDASLSTIVFFIPVVTPRYFQSVECRRELSLFARRADQLGVRQLLMPILYVDHPSFHAEPPVDELVEHVKSFHWEDWTDLRFESPESPSYRRAIAKMAQRLAQAGLQVEQVDTSAVPDVGELDDDDSPGFIDLLARAEEAMAGWVDTLGNLNSSIETVAAITTDGAARIKVAESRGKPLAGRLEVFRQLAVEFDAPSSEIQETANVFTSQLNDIDAGIQTIIAKAIEELDEGSGESLLGQLAEFRGQLQVLAEAADEGLGALSGMVDSINSVEDQSRNIRPILRRMRRGLTVLADGRNVINGWVVSVDCVLDKYAPDA
jgi:TIR domain